jgi:hypothetical protein
MSVQEKRNSEFFLRPRFSIDLQENSEELQKRIEDYLSSATCKFKSKVSEDHFFIDVPDKKSHFWSPQLYFEIEKIDEKSSTIKGLFGPKPQVWTLFMFLHFVVATMFLGFGVMAYVRHRLDESLFFPLAMLIALPLIWVLLYVLGSLGKETGKNQMKELHDFLIDIIEN